MAPLLCSEVDFAAILVAAKVSRWQGDHTAAAGRLNQLLQEFLYVHRTESKPAPSSLLKELRLIKRAAIALKRQLPKADDGSESLEAHLFRRLATAAKFHGERIGGYADFPPVATNSEFGPNYRGTDRLLSALEGVGLLADWAVYAEQPLQQDIVKKRTKTGKGDRALNAMLADLWTLWSEGQGSPPTTWLKDGTQQSSRFNAFTVSVRDHLLKRLMPEHYEQDGSLREALSTLTPSASHYRLRRSKDLK